MPMHMDLPLHSDHPMDDDDQIDAPSSSQWIARAARTGSLPADVDSVRWQSSQTACTALDTLMEEARKQSIQSSPRNMEYHTFELSPLASSLGSSDLYSTYASTSASSSESMPGTSSRTRTRPPRNRPSDRLLSRTASTSASSYSSTSIPLVKDSYIRFQELLKGVSEQMDENARLKKKHMVAARNNDGCRSGSASPEVRRRTEKENRGDPSSSSCPSDVAINDGAGSGTVDIKGKAPVVAHRSLPDLGASPMDVDAVFQADMDIDPHPRPALDVQSRPRSGGVPKAAPSQSYMPPPRVPASKIKAPDSAPPRPVRHPPSAPASAAPNRVNSSTNTTTKPPSHKSKACPQSTNSSHHNSVPAPSRSSQQSSSRPPVLGMRRITPYSSLSSSQQIGILPEKQRGFKPPLAKIPLSKQDEAPPCTLPTPESTPQKLEKQADKDQEHGDTEDDRSSSPAPAEADSSYGEMSFDMDALEETMRKYD